MATFPKKERFWPVFSRIIEHDKSIETFFKVPQGTLPNIVQVIRSFPGDLRGR